MPICSASRPPPNEAQPKGDEMRKHFRGSALPAAAASCDPSVSLFTMQRLHVHKKIYSFKTVSMSKFVLDAAYLEWYN